MCDFAGCSLVASAWGWARTSYRTIWLGSDRYGTGNEKQDHVLSARRGSIGHPSWKHRKHSMADRGETGVSQLVLQAFLTPKNDFRQCLRWQRSSLQSRHGDILVRRSTPEESWPPWWLLNCDPVRRIARRPQAGLRRVSQSVAVRSILTANLHAREMRDARQ